MDYFTVLNYQGSKKNLIEFIHESLNAYIDETDIILDIFCGTCSVGYSYKRSNTVFANDTEKYAQTIASALLGPGIDSLNVFNVELYKHNLNRNLASFQEDVSKEELYLNNRETKNLISLYREFKTIWNSDIFQTLDKSRYQLFVSYYSTSYFGIRQAIEIDSIRETIETCDDCNRNVLLTCLFFAMKECVFSKDGHMAQPLDLEKNSVRLINQREKSIYSYFVDKLSDFLNGVFPSGKVENKTFNEDFESVIKNKIIQDDVTVIYADPPYTDMQYSRYYHLLNTVIDYNYPKPTVSRGKYTKGLYLENRFQSQLSRKSSCLDSMEKLIEFSKKYNKTLAISFAYPQNRDAQKTDRYVMSIDGLIESCKKEFGTDKVHVRKVNYQHSNNRNSETKKVLEYLIICERER